MAKAFWSGEITFGMVNIPVKLYTASRNLSPSFHLVCKVCKNRIKYIKRCEFCGKDRRPDEVERALEVEPGRMVILSKEEIEEAASTEREKNAVQIHDFVELSQVDPVFFVNAYYLAPASRRTRAYHLLRQTLSATGKVGIGSVVLRSRSHLAAIRTKGPYLVLHTMHFGDEMVGEQELPVVQQEDKPSEKELELARELVERLSVAFDSQAYEDEYRKRVEQLVEAKLEGEEPVMPGAEPYGGEVLDLMEALRRTMEEREQKGKVA